MYTLGTVSTQLKINSRTNPKISFLVIIIQVGRKDGETFFLVSLVSDNAGIQTQTLLFATPALGNREKEAVYGTTSNQLSAPVELR